MTVFGDYSHYYNLFYKDKEYARECQFVLELLKKAGSRPESLLDLGCGTGKHAAYMARRGIRVSGVDLSDAMLGMARDLMAHDIHKASGSVCFQQGDARTVRLPQMFDAVTALFHVMSYQTKDEDALAVLRTAREHIAPGRHFFFDFWHMPGVRADPPVYRERTLEDDTVHVTRTATPKHHEQEHIVEVHYDITLTDKQNGAVSYLSECHEMRYWDIEELAALGLLAGFSVAASGGWMHTAPAGPDDWNAWVLLRAI